MIDWKPFTRDVFFYLLSIALLLLMISWDGSDGAVEWWEGLIMFLAYGAYVAWMIVNDWAIDNTCGRIEKCREPKSDEGSDEEDDIELTGFNAEASGRSGNVTAKARTLGLMNMNETEKKLLRPKLLKFRHKYWAVVADPDNAKRDAELGDGGADEDEDDHQLPGMVCITAFADRLTNAWMFTFAWTIPNCNIEEVEEKLLEADDDDEKTILVQQRTKI